MTSVDIGRFVERMDKAQNSSIESAVRKACFLVQADAKGRALVHDGELRRTIVVLPIQNHHGDVRGVVQCNAAHGLYVEMGTGPKGAANHSGISPNVNVAYTLSPWWIHEGPGENEVDRETAEYYHWLFVDTPQGRFYRCTGQAANPFLYPALHDNRDKIREIFQEELEKNL